jgi:hypothetical protein
LCINDPQDYYKLLDKAELKAGITDWVRDYPCIAKISLYRMRQDKVFKNDPKYVFVVVEPGFPPKSDRKTESAQNIITYYEETDADCSHIYHLMKDFYRMDKLPENKLPDNYRDEWFWFSIEPGERIEDYEMVMDVKPLVLYERDDQPCSAAGTAEPSIVEDIDDFPENHINSFTLKGDYWDIRYRGEETRIRNLERICYIVHLLDNPGVEFSSHSLTSLVKGNIPLPDQELSKKQLKREGLTQDEVLTDGFTVEDYENFKKSARRLWEYSIISPDNEKAQTDWESCKNIAQNEYGIVINDSGKSLKFFKKEKLIKDFDKPRSNVTKQISAAIKDLENKLPSLAEHLKKHIPKGAKRIYHIDQNNLINWNIRW